MTFDESDIGLDRYSVLLHLEMKISGMSNNTTEKPEQEKANSQSINLLSGRTVRLAKVQGANILPTEFDDHC